MRAIIRRFVIALRVPQAVPVLGFAAVILIGSVLLWMPWAHSRGSVSYLDALFTSTSAVCVTGLVVVDTASDFTPAGQAVILLLIQIGGLGVMTYAAMALSLFRRRMSLRAQAAVHNALFQKDEARDFKRRFWQILYITFSIEALGALVMFLAQVRTSGAGYAAWAGVFHSVSAFCNAGFSIFPENMAGEHLGGVFLAAVMILVVVGGLGFTVLHELRDGARHILMRRRREGPHIFSLHVNLVLRTSLILIVGGALAVILFGLTPNEVGWGSRVEAAVFQSISARTAGFNSVDIAALPVASLLILIGLMFIGGSPASCAGGIKTSTAAVLFARVRGYIRGEDEARLLGRTMSRQTIHTAGLLLVLAVVWNLIGVLVLTAVERGHSGFGLDRLLFEQISAFGTVGLSADVTPGLSAAGKLWIMATMFVGRLGPLTLASLAVYRKPARVSFPEGKVMIG